MLEIVSCKAIRIMDSFLVAGCMVRGLVHLGVAVNGRGGRLREPMTKIFAVKHNIEGVS